MSSKLGAHWRATCLASLSIVAFALLAGSAAAAETPGETFAASVTPAGEFAEGGVSGAPTISADGRFVAFLSGSANLNSEGTTSTQAYVKDLETGAMTLASRGEGIEGRAADEPVARPLLSSGGRYLAFESSADNLVAALPTAPVPPVTHVYRRDLRTGETTIVDRVDGTEGEIVTTESHVLAISADGTLVAFTDLAQELEDPAGAHGGGEETIYVRDLEDGTTTEIAAEGSEEAAFSADDRYLLFTSAAATLPEPTGEYEIYRRDLQTGETALVSRGNPTGSAPEGEPADGETFQAVFVGSSDCEVAFAAAQATNLSPGGDHPPFAVYEHDFCSSPSVTTLLSVDEEGEPFEAGIFPSTTADGRIAFIAQKGPFDPRRLYLRDPVAQQTILVERATGPEGEPSENEVSGERAAMVSSNGCRGVFVTSSTNLLEEEAAGPLPGGAEAFVRQLAPCKPPPGDEISKPGSTPTSADNGQSQSPGPAAAKTISGGHLGPRSLSLVFDGPGQARLRIQNLITGRHHGWHLVKVLIVKAAAAGLVKVELPSLPPGRYRLKFRLQGDPDNPTMTRHLEVGDG